MATRTLKLTYPPSLLRRPVINQLIRRFEITINITRAHITLERGWLVIEASGSIEDIDEAASWLTSEGIEVTKVD
jgi:ABC-type methionine transport system ATPase subunit